MTRRGLLSWLISLGSLLFTGALGIPSLIAGLSPSLKSRGETWRRIGSLNDFAVGSIQESAVQTDPNVWPRSGPKRAIFVWRKSKADVVVFSRSCTDLGCALNFDSGSHCYFCPCHGGIFSHEGDHMAGPPKRPMDRYALRIRNGVLEVDISSVPPAA